MPASTTTSASADRQPSSRMTSDTSAVVEAAASPAVTAARRATRSKSCSRSASATVWAVTSRTMTPTPATVRSAAGSG